MSDFDTGSLDFPPAADINLYSGLGNLADIDFNLGGTGGIFDAEGNINPGAALFLTDSLNADIFEQFKRDFPQEAALLDDPEMKKLLRQQALTQSGQNAVANIGPQGDTDVQSQSADKTSLPDRLKKLIANATGLGEDTIGELGKYGLLAGIAKLAYDDAEKARKAKLGYIAPGGSAKRAVISPGGSVSYTKAASGGIMSLASGGSVDEYGRTAQDKQKENLYRQLEAMDAWNTTQATNAGRGLLPKERMMAVGVKDDFTESGPGVLLYDPAKGQSEIIDSGNLSLLLERGDPAAAYEQAKNSLPYYQQKALLGIEGPTTQAQEWRIVKTMINNPLPALPFIEYGLGQFAPPNYGLDANISRRREENKLLGRKEEPFEYFKDFLNLSPYQGGLPTIYQFPELTGYAEGGMTDKQPFYLGGITDGMADQIPAHIDNQRPAALSDGEFVIPADVVSHLGNGNSNAGAKRLYEMMDSIREARTGNSEQGKQINPNKFLPR